MNDDAMTNSSPKKATKVTDVLAGSLALVAIIGGLALPTPPGWSADAIAAAGLTIAAITLWASSALPMGVVAIGFLLLAVLLKVQPAAIVFSGFQSGALWLVFGGMVIGTSVAYTGLGKRLAALATSRLGQSYFGVLIGVAGAALILSFLIPSAMARSVLMVPIVVSVAENLGFGPGSRGRTGMILVAALVSFASGGTILTAVLPAIILAGAAETLYGIHITYGGYLLASFPVMGLCRALLIVGLAWWMFADKVNAAPTPKVAAPALSVPEVRLAFLLAATLILWATDSFHGIHAAWVALGVALLMLTPGLRLVPSHTLNKHLDYSSFFYTAAVIGLGAVITGSGFAGGLAHWLIAVYPGEITNNTLEMAGLSVAFAMLGPLITNPGIPAVMSPLAGDLSILSGLPVESILMAQVFGFSNVILPHQAAPFVVALTMAGASLRDGARFALVTTLASILLIIPLQAWWWQVLGYSN